MMKKMKIAAAMILCLCMLTAVFPAAGETAEGARSVLVIGTEGACTVERGGETLEASAGTELLSGDVFETPEDGSARIRLDEDKFLYLDGATRIGITAEGTAEESKTLILVEKGSLYTDVRQKLSEGSSFAIAAGGTVMQIRGTKTLTQVIEDAITGRVRTSNAVLEGQVKIKAVKVKSDGTVVSVEKDLGAGDGNSFEVSKEELVSQEEMKSIADVGASLDGVKVEIVTEEEDGIEFDLTAFEGGFLENVKNILIAEVQEETGEEGLTQEQIDAINAQLDEILEQFEEIRKEAEKAIQQEQGDGSGDLDPELPAQQDPEIKPDSSYDSSVETQSQISDSYPIVIIDPDPNTVSISDPSVVINDEEAASYPEPCPHNSTVVEGALDATCTTEGYTGDTWCDDCDTKIASGEVIPKTKHIPAEAVQENPVAATCSAKGSYDSVVYCEECGAEISRTTVETGETNPTNHAGGTEVRGAAAATCSAEGYTGDTYCKGCGEKIETGTVIAKADHTPAEAVQENPAAATCVAKGSYDSVVYCKECGAEISRIKVETGETNPANHAGGLQAVSAKAPDCLDAEKPGNIAYWVCPDCGTLFSDAAGTTVIEINQVILPGGQHQLTHIPEKEPTCTAGGNHEYYVCTVCGKLFFDAAAEEEASGGYACIDLFFGPEGHQLTHIPRKDPTCTEGGNDDYYICGVCGKLFFYDDPSVEAVDGYACNDIFFGPEGHQLRSDPVAVDDIGPIYQCGVCNGYFYGDGTPAQVNLE